jgi:putative methionine-R-sulfoxide reductase with GAF domain
LCGELGPWYPICWKDVHMTDLSARQLKFLAIYAGGILLILIGAYVLSHPAVQTSILVLCAVGVAVLWILRLALYRMGKASWFPRLGALIGIVVLALLVSLSGGATSDFWPAFLLITVGIAAVLSRTEVIVLYALTAVALVAVHVYPLHAWGLYDVILLLARLGAVLIPAELYRHLYLIREHHQEELMRASQREEKVSRDLSRRNIELNLLNNVALTLNSSLDLDRVLTRVIELTNASLGIELGSVSLVDEESGDLVLRTLVGKEAISVDGLHIPRDRGIAGWVAVHGETAVVHDVQHDPRFYGKVDELSGFTTRSMMCIPLRSKGHIIGVVEAMNKIQGEFNQEDRQLLEGLAEIAGPATENALLHTQLVKINDALIQRYRELQEAQEQLVTAEKRAAAVELAGAAAHQLNQPLTVILCSLGLIRRTLPPGHPALEDIDAIEEAIDQATEIVNKIGSITEYKTKTYVEGIQILDLDQSSSESGPES